MKNILVSVIVPAYQDWDRLKLCLDALRKQTYPFDSYEVIIVNNDPGTTCPFKLPALNMKIIEETTPGSYVARNTGANISQGKILAFTDSDCIPDKNWLTNAEELFITQQCDLIGGKVEIFRENGGSRLAYIYERNRAFMQHINVPKGKSVTANLFVRKSIFEEVGKFNPAIKSGGDWEFTRRCINNNYRMVYGDSVKVLHPARRNLSGILKKQYRLVCWETINLQREYGYSKLRILLKNMIYGIIKLLNFKRYPKNIFESLIVFVVDLLKLTFILIISFLLTINLINPYSVRK